VRHKPSERVVAFSVSLLKTGTQDGKNTLNARCPLCGGAVKVQQCKVTGGKAKRKTHKIKSWDVKNMPTRKNAGVQLGSDH